MADRDAVGIDPPELSDGVEEVSSSEPSVEDQEDATRIGQEEPKPAEPDTMKETLKEWATWIRVRETRAYFSGLTPHGILMKDHFESLWSEGRERRPVNKEDEAHFDARYPDWRQYIKNNIRIYPASLSKARISSTIHANYLRMWHILRGCYSLMDVAWQHKKLDVLKEVMTFICRAETHLLDTEDKLELEAPEALKALRQGADFGAVIDLESRHFEAIS